ncbi:Pectin lyase-like superfamily protein isoform 1 [Hibiscus syriacus]|uniref:Pectin lyase-like superfamily protein isoform 1 n=1 Tax=Hibiscus syriacus TaxID=106335 RepID=A0A6A2ZYX3_HIBSY|nr:uncharacterized protein LOC120136375 [Hibiscus syriacus]KAE8697231.1 Pectin lyase-like superfamily protein isoform 1 [Hibiscus syriacus]
MPSRNKAAKSNIQDGSVPQHQEHRIDLARVLASNSLPEKVWLKQQFAIGVNDVIERMPAIKVPLIIARDDKSKKVPLIIVRDDKSKKVPLVIVRDDKKGSLRLGELVKLKTTIVIGVKARGSAVNQIMERILDGDELNQGAALQVQ